MKYIQIFVALAVLILASVFAGQNTAEVTVSFYSWSATGPLALVVAVSLAVGVVLGILILLPAVIGGSFKRFAVKKKLDELAKANSSAEAPKKECD